MSLRRAPACGERPAGQPFRLRAEATISGGPSGCDRKGPGMENAGFWAVAGLMAFGVSGLLILSVQAARRGTPAPAAAEDLQVYRDQLREVDRDLARGTLNGAEGQRLKTEIARRLLDADRKASAALPQAAAGRGGLIAAGLAVLAAAAAALAIYARTGVPGYPDLPLAARLAEADAALATRPAQAEYVATLAPPARPCHGSLVSGADGPAARQGRPGHRHRSARAGASGPERGGLGQPCRRDGRPGPPDRGSGCGSHRR